MRNAPLTGAQMALGTGGTWPPQIHSDPIRPPPSLSQTRQKSVKQGINNCFRYTLCVYTIAYINVFLPNGFKSDLQFPRLVPRLWLTFTLICDSLLDEYVQLLVCGDAVPVASPYLAITLHIAYNTLSHVYFLAFLGGVQFTYVVSTTRCIYTCPVSSGMQPRPPPEVVWAIGFKSVSNAFRRAFTPGLFTIG